MSNTEWMDQYFNNRKDISLLYKDDNLNKSFDSDIQIYQYIEEVAEKLNNNFHLLEAIKKTGKTRDQRDKPFNCNLTGSQNVEARIARDGYISYNENSLAIAILNQAQDSCLGQIIDHHTPLKAELSNDPYGEIDILSVKDNIVYLNELKIDISKENLIRAILEIFTYWKIVMQSRESFLNDFALSNNLSIIPSIVLEEGSESLNQLKDLSNLPNTRELINNLSQHTSGFKFFSFNKSFQTEKPEFKLDENNKVLFNGEINLKECLIHIQV